MEININQLVSSRAFTFSHSAHEGGENAGRNTWNAAKEAGKDSPILTTPEELQALRDYVKGFGAWDAEEIAGWDDAECNALFLQLVSGDVREAGWDSLDEAEWDDEGGIIDSRTGERSESCGHLYQGGDGSIYYYLGE